jgi:hypothetical protein
MIDAHLGSVGRVLEALDVEGLLAHYAPNFVFEDAAAGLEISGRDGLRDYFESLFSLEGVAFTDVIMFEDGHGHGACEWTWSGRGQNGTLFRVKGASIFLLGPAGHLQETLYLRPPRL